MQVDTSRVNRGAVIISSWSLEVGSGAAGERELPPKEAAQTYGAGLLVAGAKSPGLSPFQRWSAIDLLPVEADQRQLR